MFRIGSIVKWEGKPVDELYVIIAELDLKNNYLIAHPFDYIIKKADADDSESYCVFADELFL